MIYCKSRLTRLSGNNRIKLRHFYTTRTMIEVGDYRGMNRWCVTYIKYCTVSLFVAGVCFYRSTRPLLPTPPAKLTKEILANCSFPGIVLHWCSCVVGMDTDTEASVYLAATARFVDCKLTPQSGTMTISNSIFGSGRFGASSTLKV